MFHIFSKESFPPEYENQFSDFFFQYSPFGQMNNMLIQQTKSFFILKFYITLPLKYLQVWYLNKFRSMQTYPLTLGSNNIFIRLKSNNLLTSADVIHDIINTSWALNYRVYLALSDDAKYYLVSGRHWYEKCIWVSRTPNFSWKNF